jgi:phosphate transport system substrate-binding protein
MSVRPLVALAAIAFCLQPQGARADDILGAGSTFVAPVLSKWSADYSAGGGDAVSYQRIGSGGGIASLRSGTVDFAASDAPMKPAELARLGFVQFPLVVGGVVPVVNLDGVAAGQLRLSGPVLADIYLGRLTRWNDPAIAALNPGLKLPASAIIVAHRVDASGTTFNWTNYLSKVSTDWRDKVGEGLSVPWPIGVGGKGNAGVAAFVKQTPNAIGYVDFGDAQRSQLAHALVQNKAGRYTTPGPTTFEAATVGADWSSAAEFHVVITDPPQEDAWPVAATSFALMYAVPRVPSRTRAGLDFFRWGLNDGRRQAVELGYVPLPPAVVSQVDAYWRARFTDALRLEADGRAGRRVP